MDKTPEEQMKELQENQKGLMEQQKVTTTKLQKAEAERDEARRTLFSPDYEEFLAQRSKAGDKVPAGGLFDDEEDDLDAMDNRKLLSLISQQTDKKLEGMAKQTNKNIDILTAALAKQIQDGDVRETKGLVGDEFNKYSDQIQELRHRNPSLSALEAYKIASHGDHKERLAAAEKSASIVSDRGSGELAATTTPPEKMSVEEATRKTLSEVEGIENL